MRVKHGVDESKKQENICKYYEWVENKLILNIYIYIEKFI